MKKSNFDKAKDAKTRVGLLAGAGLLTGLGLAACTFLMKGINTLNTFKQFDTRMTILVLMLAKGVKAYKSLDGIPSMLFHVFIGL